MNNSQTTGSETLETDDLAFKFRGGHGLGPALEHARSLERSRNALRSENERLREELEQWKKVASSFYYSLSLVDENAAIADYENLVKLSTPPTEEKE